MKKITFLFILCLTMAHWSYSQCTTSTGGQWPTGTVTLSNSGGAETISTQNWPNAEFSIIDGVLPGSDYTVAANPSLYITVTNTADDSVIVHGAGSVSFTAAAGVTGLTIYWHVDAACGTAESPDTTTTIQCTSCTCPETAAPGAPTNPTPADTAVDIPIDISGATPLITPFEWVESTSGGANETFSLTLGTDPAGTNIGTIPNFPSGNGITYGSWANATTYYWSVTATNCFGSTQSAVWSFTTAGCTATVPPVAVTSPTPADTAIDIPIDDSDPANLLITPFEWVEAPFGEAAESFNINLGITMTGDDIGTVTGATSGNGITYTWEYSTTYYWYVDAVNCFGVSPSSVWSFTTEDDPSLAVEDDEINLFNVFPNPVKDMVRIDSSLQIDSVSLINHLGQIVLTVNGNRLINNELDMSSISSGLYFMEINAEDKSQTIKIIKE